MKTSTSSRIMCMDDCTFIYMRNILSSFNRFIFMFSGRLYQEQLVEEVWSQIESTSLCKVKK